MANARGGDGETAPPGDVVQLEPPMPLTRELPPAEPFPVDALGSVLGPAAEAIHSRVRAPLAIGAQSVLAAATLAVQGHADVELPIGPGIGRPVSEFFATVAETGERKTTSDEQAIWPIRRFEKQLRERHDAEMLDYKNDKLAWDRAREVIIRGNKTHKGDRSAIAAALGELGPAPSPPLDPMLTADEPTFEGMCKLFVTGHPSLGLFSTEGGQFIGGHGMNEENRLKTAAGMSSLWDGQPIRRVRAGDGSSVLPGRRFATHLQMQPAVADLLFGNILLAEQGLLSRHLAVFPDNATGTRFQQVEGPQVDCHLKRYSAILLGILQQQPPLVPGKRNELDPRRLPLSPQAIEHWRSFADHIERQLTPYGSLEPVKGLGNKLPEHAARLAAVLSLVTDLDAGEIDKLSLEAGIVLAEHYAGEALRLFGTGQEKRELRQAKELLHWLQSKWSEPAVSLPDIYRRGPNAIRDRATTKKLVTILEEHRWLRRINEGAIVAGQQRRDAWRIWGKR
jgi:Protein of unknown function (DUF3987)